MMNKYLDALWELKLRVDAHDEYDDKANEAFCILKTFINERLLEDQSRKEVGEDYYDMVEAINFMKNHLEVQDHPDIFFHREMPERILIDLRYLISTDSLVKPLDPEETALNNEMYNRCKKLLGLPEYKEEH